MSLEVCPDCFSNGKFPENSNTTQFTKVELPIEYDPNDWSEQETLLLLEVKFFYPLKNCDKFTLKKNISMWVKKLRQIRYKKIFHPTKIFPHFLNVNLFEFFPHFFFSLKNND